MLIALLLVFIGILLMFFAVGREPIPWMSRLRRVQAGVAQKAEWIAPDNIIDKVRGDYLSAVEWLASAALGEQVNYASQYLTGRYLARFQTIISYPAAGKRTYFMGVLAARHHIQVRQFSEDGSRCLVVDCQTERRMESRRQSHPEWLLSQDMGDAAVVFQMCYDVSVKCWKIESFIQELPTDWCNRTDVGHVRFISNMPTTIGRDY